MPQNEVEREPEVLDVVEAPGGECQLYGRGGAPDPCDNDAEYLFVHEGNFDPDVDTRRNALACSDCFRPPREMEVTA